ncbi:unnamed protein product, partial [Anisakis simplex]|uniref:Lachesin n=1 Tax=Anisakis simplex TaxID=6269 RepID=A0A0M3K5L9_ANISI
VFRQRDKYEVRPRVNGNEWVLVVKNVQENDIGGYSCQLNTDPVLSRVGFLHLRVPPYVARTTASAVEVREGHNVTLSCRAFGNPTPTVIWRRQDRQIIRFNGATGYGASVFNGTDLVLTKVSRKHMSEYVCVASNGIPPDESWSVKLHVTFEPIVIPQSKVVIASRGAQARLVCNVEAWPRPTMTWEKDGEELFDSTNYAMSEQVSEKYRSVHILTIKHLSADHFGTYRCTALNDNGIHFADIVLKEGQGSPRSNLVLLTEGSGLDEDAEQSDDGDSDNEPGDGDEDGDYEDLDSDDGSEVETTAQTERLPTTSSIAPPSYFRRPYIHPRQGGVYV